MAAEWVCIERPRVIVRRTVADGTAISKGRMLKLTDPNTAIDATDAAPFGGVAVESKTASDGVTELGVAIDGVWDATCSGSATVGAILRISSANYLVAAVAGDLLTGSACAKTEETGTHDEVIRVRLIGY